MLTGMGTATGSVAVPDPQSFSQGTILLDFRENYSLRRASKKCSGARRRKSCNAITATDLAAVADPRVRHCPKHRSSSFEPFHAIRCSGRVFRRATRGGHSHTPQGCGTSGFRTCRPRKRTAAPERSEPKKSETEYRIARNGIMWTWCFGAPARNSRRAQGRREDRSAQERGAWNCRPIPTQ